MTAHDAIKSAESNLAAQLRAAAALLDQVGTSDLAAASAELERAARGAKERLQAAAKGAAVLLASVAATAEALAAELAVALGPAAEATPKPVQTVSVSPAPEHAGPSGEEAEAESNQGGYVPAPVNRVADHLPPARCASPVDADDDGAALTGDALKRAETAFVTAPAEEVAGRAVRANGRARKARR